MIAVLAVAVALLAPVARAETTEPVVYFFWSASCPYCKAARTFLLDAQAKDPGLTLLDFEVDNSMANTRLLARLYDKIGLPELRVVPAVVIGHHIIIGYIDNASTGREILDTLAECRKTGCNDVVRELIEEQDRFEATVALAPVRRPECRREPGRAVR
jgi:glutaredoxin